MASPIVSRLQMMRLDEIIFSGDEGRVEEIPIDEIFAGDKNRGNSRRDTSKTPDSRRCIRRRGGLVALVGLRVSGSY